MDHLECPENLHDPANRTDIFSILPTGPNPARGHKGHGPLEEITTEKPELEDSIITEGPI
jgi:hypothetical protein